MKSLKRLATDRDEASHQEQQSEEGEEQSGESDY